MEKFFFCYFPCVIKLKGGFHKGIHDGIEDRSACLGCHLPGLPVRSALFVFTIQPCDADNEVGVSNVDVQANLGALLEEFVCLLQQDSVYSLQVFVKEVLHFCKIIL